MPAFGSIALVEAAAQRKLLSPEERESLLKAILDLGVWGAALDPPTYVDVARRANFDLGQCGRALPADEALLRVDQRFPQNAELLAAIAIEQPALLDDWARMIVEGYVQLVGFDATVAASLLIALQLRPEEFEATDDTRRTTTRIIGSLRLATGYTTSNPTSDPLSAAIARWLQVIPDKEERASCLDRLIAQLDPEIAAALPPDLVVAKDE